MTIQTNLGQKLSVMSLQSNDPTVSIKIPASK
jgi:hypothetical protein